MPVSNTSIVERIARVIAGRVASINAEGEDRSAGDRVDATWRWKRCIAWLRAHGVA